MATNARTHLFVDDHDILYRAGTKRLPHTTKSYPGNPLIRDDKPWECKGTGYCSVYPNPESGRYQLWYQACALKLAQDKANRVVMCYAESDDGIHWDKPNLGLHCFNGDDAANNIVLVGNGGLSTNYGAGVAVDPREQDPAKKYKLAYWEFAAVPGHDYPGVFVAFSPDGINWTKHSDLPVLRTAYDDCTEPPYDDDPQYGGIDCGFNVGIGDVMDVMWNPYRQVWQLYHKTWLDGPDGKRCGKRAVSRTESRDFLHWSKPELVIAPDELDGPDTAGKAGIHVGVELHSGPTFCYEGVYFSLLQVLDWPRKGEMRCELAISRDGLCWDRPFRDSPFIELGEQGTFDAGVLVTNATPVFLDNETRFYYSGHPFWGCEVPDGIPNTGIAFATVPRDRFAGVRPIDTVGQITLKPLEAKTCRKIMLNTDASSGAIRAEILTENGYILRGYSRDDAIAVTGDHLGQEIQWNGKRLAELPLDRFILRLHLENAEVFALTMTEDD